MCVFTLVPFIHVSKSRSFVTVANLALADMTFLTRYEFRDLILSLCVLIFSTTFI